MSRQDPLTRSNGLVPSIAQAQAGAPCLPAGVSLAEATLTQIQRAITTCAARRTGKRKPVRPSYPPAGDARNGPPARFTSDVAMSHLPADVKAAVARFDERLAAGEVRFGTFTAGSAGEITAPNPTEHVYTSQAMRAARRAADIELCRRHARRLHLGAVMCADS